MLAAAWEHAVEGRPQVVLVDGPSGIGKTAIVCEFVERSCERVLWGSGDGGERELAFGLVDQLIRRASGTPPALTDGTSEFASAGLKLIEALGDGPVAVVIDDAQWADPASLRAILFAARRLVEDPSSW